MKKVFTFEEQNFILQDHQPLQKAWLFWAMKESAYKAHQRRFNLSRKFGPLLYTCRLISKGSYYISGIVETDEFVYHITGKLSSKYIHCIALAHPGSENISGEIFSSTVDLKQRFLNRISQNLRWDIENLGMGKDENSVPYITLLNQRIDIPFSLSHHGKYAAFSLALMNY